jgi:hypothetical protein
MRHRALRTIAALLMTVAMTGVAVVNISWAEPGTAPGTTGGPGPSGGSGSAGGDGSAGSTGGGGDGSAGGTGGGGDGAGATSAAGLPGDTRLADEGGVFVASTGPVTFSRRAAPAAGMTLAQERTWDAFHQCATRGAMLDQLRFDGSFTFEAGSRSDVLAIQSCMSRIGYNFDR